ncbi:hypothetical protein AQULUS_17630 [Aquicella lusitana]|uniref:Uncharacterized protein n=1 Tax=Aquicella lusitana TaxID=254246 RepID=A0A370GY97_9COXI|nr:hypothetical protein C8D86_10250 [Aquicella lusitana]VVC74001.1 hypothetical protein AQULUS_17630 [Aquicella lusitana]
MEHISQHFKWNKARMTCFVQMLLVLFTTWTVNLNRLACMIQSGATG